MSHSYIEKLESPVQYRERQKINENGKLVTISETIDGSWDGEIKYKCECNKAFFNRESAEEHLREHKQDEVVKA